ncbi:AAA family ATPase [Pseudomonas soli]|uniref:AAA family ATPase n=1 Tax=Pseudomonas soli TaxID=1306993 RepID=UPI003DA9C09E
MSNDNPIQQKINRCYLHIDREKHNSDKKSYRKTKNKPKKHNISQNYSKYSSRKLEQSMPEIRKFIIRDFKGIEHIEIDVSERATCPVITLIGLNESGKTTILEALSHFVTGDKTMAALFDGAYSISSGYRIIPMHRKAAFSATVAVQAVIQLDSKDIDELVEIANSHELILDTNSLREPFLVSRDFQFDDSALEKTTNIWWIPINTKKKKQGKFNEYERPEKNPNTKDLWLESVRHIQNKLPQISYFPTFLVDIPSRILLEEHDGETAINRHYRFVIQEVLDSLAEDLNLEKHVCQRIRDYQQKDKSSNWLSVFFGSPDKGPIDSVFQKLSNAITKEVLGSWQRIFQRPISANRIAVEWNIDSTKNNTPYATFFVSDGESRFTINERSLGFRWFFSFLLFTAFKRSAQKKAMLIFDEPAANLHAKAQAELLTSFSRIASDGNMIVYSTHSHHMINPRWLGSAYIIENDALDFDQDSYFGLNAKPTKISATPYRQFVANFPSRSSYFQPVIEKLEYTPPELIGKGPYLIVEGISDYYSLELAKKILKKELKFNIMPGVGSGASDPIISQLIGQAQEFAILLDDDHEGKKAAARYRDEWFLPKKTVFTLGCVNAEFGGMALEKLLCNETIKLAMQHLKLEKSPSKKQIGWYLAEACANAIDDKAKLAQVTLERLNQVLEHAENIFSLTTTKDNITREH